MLLLDIGNSRIKWAYTQDNVWLHQGAVTSTDWPGLQLAFAALPPPHRILVSNVAGGEAASQVQAACSIWTCQIEFIEAQAAQCGVRNSYVKPTQLGSDRWASLIATWNQVRSAGLVVNCGTATTIDVLSNEGEFLGGLILPGMKLMLSSLSAGTAQLDDVPGTWREYPRCTADAIYSGAIQATVGAICRQYDLLKTSAAPCILSGGGADDIQAHLRLPTLKIDNLVLRGLQLIGREAVI